MDANSERLSRRIFLATSSCALVGSLGLPTLAGPALGQAPPAVRLGDAHVHLFNLADLPARGFFEHVVMWGRLDWWIARPLWPAMLDMICFLKSRTITARDELRAYPRDPEPELDISWDAFQDMSERRISNMARQSRVYGGAYRIAPGEHLSAPQRQLRDSYYQFAAYFRIFGRRVLRRPQPGEMADEAFLIDREIERVYRASLRNWVEGTCPEEPNATSNSCTTCIAEMARDIFHWAHMLMQSRQCLLKVYRDRIRDGSLRASRIVNLLVDYDEWLGDQPAPGSDADAQIELWTRISSDHRSGEAEIPPIDIRTFAGFDPLRDGLERRGCRRAGVPPGPTTFERNCARWRTRTIHGFKLYPPMGFRPIGNRPDMFRDDRRALRVVRQRLAECRVGWHELPALLDESLHELYSFCCRNGVPILAHAMHSNEASFCSGAHAGPSGWADVVGEYEGLRVCLGHFAETNDFLPAARLLRDRRRVHRRNWPFHGTDLLLRGNPGRASKVFVDLGDMIEFLHPDDGANRAAKFFRELDLYCETNDPSREYVMFGTDWIMLERDPRSKAYVSRIRAGLAAAGWREAWQQNLLHDNLQRFLNG